MPKRKIIIKVPGTLIIILKVTYLLAERACESEAISR